ncbi:hypothetical protein HanIR_Chr13g0637561 [Helianthus annuus]|nr:hypothetical protein HanIR_Chr13g0637561 [Helianthus annuus]
MGIYTQLMMCSPKDPIDGPKDHLSKTSHSKDQQGPRKITFRGLIIRSISFDEIKGSTSSFDLLSFETVHLSTFTNCCPSQTGGWLTWSTYNTRTGHRLHRDRIQTKYRHKCTNT